MFKYTNLNPKGLKVGDCVIRALSKALNQSWEQTYCELSVEGYLMGDIMNANSVWDSYLKHKGFTRNVISSDCPDCYTIENFACEHPQGTFVIGTGTHSTAVIDGCIYDVWDCSGEKPIYFYYQKNSKYQKN